MASSRWLSCRTRFNETLLKSYSSEARTTPCYSHRDCANLSLQGSAAWRPFEQRRLFASSNVISGERRAEFETKRNRGYCTIVKSPFPDVVIPDNLPLHQYMIDQFGKYGKTIAMVDELTGEEVSYAKLQTMVVKATSALVGMGFGKGSVATVYSSNCIEFFALYLAVGAAGGTISTVNPSYTTDELKRAISLVKSELLVVSQELLPTAEKAAQLCPSIKNIVVFGKGVTKHRSFSSLLDSDMALFPQNAKFNTKEDVYAIPFSSGTTGLPKGVMLTHYNLLANIVQSRAPQMISFEQGKSVLLAILPFYHVYGQVVVMLTGLATGLTIVVLPKFEPVSYMESIQKYSATHLHVVPPLMLFLARHPMVLKYNLSSVVSLMTGAAPCASEIIEEVFKERFSGNTTFRHGYGMTEASPLTHCSPIEGTKGQSVGPAIANTEYKIIDIESKKSLGVGELGEILIRGPQIMKGYYENPKATAETVVDGWLHSGDVGCHDANGDLTVVDRYKELIKVKGLQVAPAELEALLLTHEAVADAAVIGKQDERLGEAPVAFVVLKPKYQPSDTTAKQLQQFVAEHVASHKRLAGGVQFRKEIPKATSGKILRRVLKAEL